MQFSSPLKTNSTKVMLLGSGELGKEVIISLQRLGMEVIAVDRNLQNTQLRIDAVERNLHGTGVELDIGKRRQGT